MASSRLPTYRQCLDNAEYCEQRAAAADAKATFTLAANCWRELARHHAQPAFEFQIEAS
jgi:hypothetical protein